MSNLVKKKTLSSKSSAGSSFKFDEHYQSRESTQSIKKRIQLLKIESEVRRINRQLQLQDEIRHKRKLFEELEIELLEQERRIKEQKQQKIRIRLESLEKNKHQRNISATYSNRAISLIKRREEEKKRIMDWIIQENQKQYDECYQKALRERKKLSKPIDFSQIKKHEHHYLQKLKQTKGSIFPELIPNELQSQKTIPKIKHEKYSVANSAVSDYWQIRNKEKMKIFNIKQNLSKRYEYGNRVEKQYKNNRIKTEQSQAEIEKIEAEKKNREILQKKKILDKMKKPKLPFEHDLERKKNMEISKIKNSKQINPEDKLLRLNNLLDKQKQTYQYGHKGGRIKTQNLDRELEINLAKAQILLDQS